MKKENRSYSEAERVRIERDLLLETTYFGTADPKLNNKSVTNRTAAGLVGACVGHGPLARFGLDAFRATIDDWFLPDGATPESPAYAMMTIDGVRDFALAFRDYSDPPRYRIVRAGASSTSMCSPKLRIRACGAALINCLQGDSEIPAFCGFLSRYAVHVA